MTSEISILRLPTVKNRTGLSRSTIYSKIARGEFPQPISLGARAVGWSNLTITEWLEGRVSQPGRILVNKTDTK